MGTRKCGQDGIDISVGGRAASGSEYDAGADRQPRIFTKQVGPNINYDIRSIQYLGRFCDGIEYTLRLLLGFEKG